MKKNPVFTTALIAGDCVILDAISKAGLLDKIQIIFVDTFFLFPESIDFLHEVIWRGVLEKQRLLRTRGRGGGLRFNLPYHFKLY